MRQYKKSLKTVLILATALALILSFTGCGGGGGGGDSFTISYNANGAESGSAPKSQSGSDNELTIQGNTGNMAKGGYLFDDWNTKADGSGKTYASGAKYKGEDLTLYAKWAAIFNVQEVPSSPAQALDGVQRAPGNSTLKILGLTEKGMTLVEIEIPSAIDGELVTAIANGAFQDCSQIQAITIPGTVTSIGDNAFDGCSNLASIVMVSDVPPATIGTGAFPPGTTIYVPNSAVAAYSAALSAFSVNIEEYDPAVGAVILSSIAVTSAPTKVLYAVGESFSSTGLAVTATYTDGSSHAVSPSSIDADTSSAGIKTLTVTYTENGVTKNASTTYYVRCADSLTETPVSLGGDVYKFGDFPQTISAISSYSDAPVYYDWYLGSDGYFYEKLRAWPYDNGIDTDPTYSDGTDPVYGQEYYFKVEPIRWKKLTDNYNSSGNALLLSDKVLRGTNGYSNDGGFVYYYVSQSERTINASTVYANNYKYSSVRAYLNGSYESDDTQDTTYNGAGFLQKAFTATAQGKIATTAVKNDDENMRGNYQNNDDAKLAAYASGTTNDKVFLMAAYGPEYTMLYNAGECKRSPTDYALATRVSRNTGETGGCWLTRTPRCSADYPSNMSPEESPFRYTVYHYGSTGTSMTADTNYPGVVGIAPAITINPSNLP